jgi:hypothetical protein
MPCEDVLGNRCTHRVRIHIRTLTRPFILENDAVRNAQKVYGPYGICIQVVSAARLQLEAAKRAELRVLDGACHWNMVSDEQRQLYALGAADVPINEVLVYFVSEIKEPGGSLRGCAGHAVNRPAVSVSASGTNWTMAHELGHVLLTSRFIPVHSPSRDNLMSTPTSLITVRPPRLTAEQVGAMKRSHLCAPC